MLPPHLDSRPSAAQRTDKVDHEWGKFTTKSHLRDKGRCRHLSAPAPQWGGLAQICDCTHVRQALGSPLLQSIGHKSCSDPLVREESRPLGRLHLFEQSTPPWRRQRRRPLRDTMSNQVPTDIEDFCMQHGFAAYIGMMRENEVDLDVVRDLSAQDWADMGVQPHDVPRLIAATKTLPPGSFRVWGRGDNPMIKAVQTAMAEQDRPLPQASGKPAAHAAPAAMARFGAAAKKPPAEKKEPRMRKQVALLEDMTDTHQLKPSTEFGARQHMAQDFMVQAQRKTMQQKHAEAADLYAKAQKLFESFSDSKSAEEAASKKESSQIQAQMEAKASDAKLKKARAAINQGLRAMQACNDEDALRYFSSAEQMLEGMKDTDRQVLDEIRKHKQEADSRIASKGNAALAARQNIEQQQHDLATVREKQLREKEASLRAHEAEARKHELAARRFVDANHPAGGLRSAEQGVQLRSDLLLDDTEKVASPPQAPLSRRSEIEAIKEKRRKEQAGRMQLQRQGEQLHRTLYHNAVSHQLASALGVPELPLAPAADGSKTAAEAKDDEEKMVGRQTGERYDPTAVEPTSASGGGGRNRMTQEQSRQETLPQGVVQGTQAIEQAERDAIEKEEAKLREAQEEIERLVKEQELQMQVSTSPPPADFGAYEQTGSCDREELQDNADDMKRWLQEEQEMALREKRERDRRREEEKARAAAEEKEWAAAAAQEREREELLVREAAAEKEREIERQKAAALARLQEEQMRRREAKESLVRQEQKMLMEEAERRRHERASQERLQEERAREAAVAHSILERQRERERRNEQEEERRREAAEREQLLQQPAVSAFLQHANGPPPLSSTSSLGAPLSTSFAELDRRQKAAGTGLTDLGPAVASPLLSNRGFTDTDQGNAAPVSMTFQELQGRQGSGPAVDGRRQVVPSQPPSVVWGAASEPISSSFTQLQDRQRVAEGALAPSSRASAAPVSASMQELFGRQKVGGAEGVGQPSSSRSINRHAPISESFQELQLRQVPGTGISVQSDRSQPPSRVTNTACSSHEDAQGSVSMQALHQRAGKVLSRSPREEGPLPSADHAHAPLSESFGQLASRQAGETGGRGLRENSEAHFEVSPPPAPASGDAAGETSNSPSVTWDAREACLQQSPASSRSDDQSSVVLSSVGPSAVMNSVPVQALAAENGLESDKVPNRVMWISPAPPAPPGAKPRKGSRVPSEGADDGQVPQAQAEGAGTTSNADARQAWASELTTGAVSRVACKDWGECMLTFDTIKEAVKAADGHIYERWAIERWLAENGNRSPLTNQVIDTTLVVLADEDEGQDSGVVEPPAVPDRGGAGVHQVSVGGSVGVANDDVPAGVNVGKPVVNQELSKEERQKRATERRANFLQSQIKSQREEEEADAMRIERERMEKLKRRGFAGCNTLPPPADVEATIPDRIHPENLHSEVAGGACGMIGGKERGFIATNGNRAADRAVAMVQKKADDALRSEVYKKKDEEEWGDRMPPPNKVVHKAFIQALPSADDVFGAIRPTARQDVAPVAPEPSTQENVAESMTKMMEVTASGNIVEADARAAELINIAMAFDSNGEAGVDRIDGMGQAAAPVPAAPASVQPKGFAGGGALGALLSNASSALANRIPAVSWRRSRPDAATGSGPDGGGDAITPALSSCGAAQPIPVQRHTVRGSSGLTAHAPTRDVLGERLPPPGGGGVSRTPEVVNEVQLSQALEQMGENQDPQKDPQTSTPAPPASVGDASVIAQLSETPGWGAYAPAEKQTVVARRKAVVMQHASLLTQVGNFWFGSGDGQVRERGHDSSSSESEDEAVQVAPTKSRDRSYSTVAPPAPESSAHLRELLVTTSPGASAANEACGGKGASGQDEPNPRAKVPGPLTTVKSWMPNMEIPAMEFQFTTWEHASAPEADVSELHEASAPPQLSPENIFFGGDAMRNSEQTCSSEENKEEDVTGFALHGLGAKMWRVRKRAIPIKPMTADERDLLEQGRLGVDQFVIEEEDEAEAEDGESIPAPPNADLIFSVFDDHAAGADVAAHKAADERALGSNDHENLPHRAQAPQEPRMLASEITAVFDDHMASSGAAPADVAGGGPASRAEMVRIFSEAESEAGRRPPSATHMPPRSPGVGSRDGGGDVDLSKLSDEELLRQLQLAQEKLLHVGDADEQADVGGVHDAADLEDPELLAAEVFSMCVCALLRLVCTRKHTCGPLGE